MRHSSCTLFLVPLTIPLILIGFIWAVGSLDQAPQWGGEDDALVQEVVVETSEAAGGGTRAGGDKLKETAEALYK